MPRDEEGGEAIVTSMAKGLAGAVRGAAAVSANFARHASWYLLYRVDGNSRAQRARDLRRRS
jgi:hypothetical protein